MPEKDELISILTHPGSIRFHANENAMLAIEREITNFKKSFIDGIETWFLNDEPTVANTRIRRYPTGHLVFYNSEGKRFLFTDPGGHPLHECEWLENAETG